MKKHAVQSAGPQLARQFHLELESKADTQFEQNNLFDKARESRALARLAMRKLFVQAPVATTMSPSLQPELDKSSSVELSMEQLEALGLVKRAHRIPGFMKTAEMRAVPSHWEGDGAGLHDVVEQLIGRKKGIPVLGTASLGVKHPDLASEEPKEKTAAACKKMAARRMKLAAPKEKTSSIAPRVDEWFEKNAHVFRTEAMERFPELQKLSAQPRPSPTLRRKFNNSFSPGPVPSQSMLSGGSA